MPATPHVERHFTAGDSVRDIVIGMSDGLTVPFALAAGLSGAAASTAIVVTAGLAEIAAGAIAMGLGGYLAARTDGEHYQSERVRELREIETVPDKEEQEVAQVFSTFGLDAQQMTPLVQAIRSNRERWVEFMMKFELGLEPPNPARARQSALTIALAYIGGGLIPLSPYLLFGDISTALPISTILTLITLFVFGYAKGMLVGLTPLRSGLQTLLVGGLAAGIAFIVARLLS
jgi:VIT1/CCC1 family predicted Fe2+/Mn2+ transporter